MKLVIDGRRLEPRHHEAIRKVVPDLDVVAFRSDDELLTALPEADILACWTASVPRSTWKTAGGLRWIHVFSAGVDRILTPEIMASDVIITNSRGVNGIPISEHAMAMILAYERCLPVLWRNQAARRWQRAPAQEIFGRTMGIAGFGGIGQRLACRAKAFGLSLAVLRRTSGVALHGEGDVASLVDRFYVPSQLHEFLSGLDYLVLALPLTPATRGMIDASALSRMKPHAVLVNVARGPIVDQAALIAVLRGARLRGALLDCFEDEPPSPDSPLWEMPNVMISPHMSGASDRTVDRGMEIFLGNLERFLRSQPMLSVVDRTIGY